MAVARYLALVDGSCSWIFRVKEGNPEYHNAQKTLGAAKNLVFEHHRDVIKNLQTNMKAVNQIKVSTVEDD